MIYQCFGTKGITALAFWLGALFAEQIRDMHKSYPFVEIIGEPGAGKSTLIEFMWKLFGRRDYEGFDPSKSTLAARARNFSQVGNMPVVLIEGDRDDTAKARGFDWDEMKTAYNGRASRSRGMKNGGNETYEPPFRGAIVISQNAEVNASEAVLQRIVHLKFTKDAHNMDTKSMAETLEQMPMEQVSGFLIKAVMQEHQILDVVKRATPQYEKRILGLNEIKSVRIAKNHAQVQALVKALQIITPLTDEQTKATIKDLAVFAAERQKAINSDHPMVQSFWETYDYLNGSDDVPHLNHSKKGRIAINLNHFVRVAADKRQQIPDITELKRHLKTSKARKFIGANLSVSSALHSTGIHPTETVKCWVFEKEQ